MTDYQKMYAILCGAASDALDLLADTKENERARDVLQCALLQAEEMYIRSCEEE